MIEIETRFGCAELSQKEYDKIIKPFVEFFEHNYVDFVKELFKDIFISISLEGRDFCVSCWCDDGRGVFWEKREPLKDVLDLTVTMASDGGYGSRKCELADMLESYAKKLREV